MICLYPVPNPLATAARPKPCGKGATVTTRTIVVTDHGRTELSTVCLKHSISIAAGRIARTLQKPFTDEEKEELAKYYPEFRVDLPAQNA